MNVPLDRERLAKLLGLLGSDYDGEVAAAGRATDRLIRDAGLRWPDIILPALPAPTPPRSASLAETLRFCWQNSECLTMWERGFLASLHRQKRVSDKQAAILDRVVEKLRRDCARAA